MELLTQKQAHKRFPNAGYDNFEKMHLLVGTRKEFKEAKLYGTAIRIKVGGNYATLATNPVSLMSLVGKSKLDSDTPEDTRLVIWE